MQLSLWRVAVQLVMEPSEPINHACEDWADTKAAYRFFDNKKVTAEDLLKPHQQWGWSAGWPNTQLWGGAGHEASLTSRTIRRPKDWVLSACGVKSNRVSACIGRWLEYKKTAIGSGDPGQLSF